MYNLSINIATSWLISCSFLAIIKIMPKWILYIVILGLVGFIAYQTFDFKQFFAAKPDVESKIEVSPATVTKTEPVTATSSEDTAKPETLIAISGALVRFEEIPDRTTGKVTVYALIDDGTEFISIDMSRIVQPGVSAPQDQLGLTIGKQVTVHGELVDGVFVAHEIE